MYDQQSGLSSYAYRWSIGYGEHRPAHPMSTAGFVEKAAHFGFGRVQICDNLRYDKLSVPELQKIVSLTNNRGITIETGARGTDHAYLRRVLEVSSILNSDLLRIVPEIDRSNQSDRISEELDKLIADLEFVLPLAKTKGIRLAIENHATLTSGDLLYVIRSVNDQDVGVCFDTMNSIVLMELPMDTVQVLAPYILTVHLKDFRIEKHPECFLIKGVAMGDGAVDFPQIVRVLNESGVTPTTHVELYVDRKEDDESTLAWEDECVRRSLKYLRSLSSTNDELRKP